MQQVGKLTKFPETTQQRQEVDIYIHQTIRAAENEDKLARVPCYETGSR
jgi:hypothetical protein